MHSPYPGKHTLILSDLISEQKPPSCSLCTKLDFDTLLLAWFINIFAVRKNVNVCLSLCAYKGENKQTHTGAHNLWTAQVWTILSNYFDPSLFLQDEEIALPFCLKAYHLGTHAHTHASMHEHFIIAVVWLCPNCPRGWRERERREGIWKLPNVTTFVERCIFFLATPEQGEVDSDDNGDCQGSAVEKQWPLAFISSNQTPCYISDCTYRTFVCRYNHWCVGGPIADLGLCSSLTLNYFAAGQAEGYELMWDYMNLSKSCCSPSPQM